jgi:hypothetical protein
MDGSGIRPKAGTSRAVPMPAHEIGSIRQPDRRVRMPSTLARLWCQEASQGLSRRNPELSARTGVTRSQSRVAVLILIVIFAALALWPQVTQTLGMVGLGAIFATLIALRVAASCLAPQWAKSEPIDDDALPAASLIIPLYREAAILPALVDGLLRLDYPRARLEIKLAIEIDDEATLKAAMALPLPDHFQIITVPRGEPRTKPRALNFAVRFCAGEIITILDAEDRPHPRQLRQAAEAFACAGPDLACIQAPLNWYNRSHNWLTRQFSLEYAAHFHALLPLYKRMSWPLPLGGTSNYFRTRALRRIGGWDPWNVTEDADLGFRLHRLGFRCDLISPMTLEEAPVRAWPWVCQRTRWLKGYAQTLGVHLRFKNAMLPAFAIPSASHLPSLLLTIGASLLSALVHAPLAGFCIYLVFRDGIDGAWDLFAPLCLSAGYIAAAVCAATGMRRAGLSFRWFDLVTMPFYWPLQTLAAGRALWQLLTNPFYWDKTEHGISTDPTAECISPSSQRALSSASVSSCSASHAGARAKPCVPKKVHASSPGP